VPETSYFFFEDLQWATYSATSSTWVHGMVTIGYAQGASGNLQNGFSGVVSSNCGYYGGGGGCTATSLTSPDPQAVTIAAGSVSYFEWSESDAGLSATTANSITYLNGDLGVVWDVALPYPLQASDVVNTPNGPISGLNGRCDTMATSTDGCVNDFFSPTFTIDSTAYPLVGPVAQHIYDAQNGGLSIAWGVPTSVNSSGGALHRDTSDSDRRANNLAACAGVSIGPGQNCDEFPFESTYEGAAFQSVFSAIAVPATANSSQGGLIAAFYGGNRVLDGADPFYVRAILPNGTASW
jgi:hypothetical protein